jgi:diguanylate cyclase
MKPATRLKLSVVMIAFVLIIAFTIAIMNHLKTQKHQIEMYQSELRVIENYVNYTIQLMDDVFYYMNEDLNLEMEKNSKYLLELYEKNPNFDEWDFRQLKDRFGMDVYIINDQNVITHSSFVNDIGLNFSQCCSEFSRLLNERRSSQQFFSDGIDVQQNTGNLMKYSYMPTPDGKYIIELGYSLNSDQMFQNVNFLPILRDLITKHEQLLDINILNVDGYPYGEKENTNPMNEDRIAAFMQAIETQDEAETEGVWNEKPAFYRYIYYSANKEQGISTNRVIEVIYHKEPLERILQCNTRNLVIQLTTIFFITVLISFIIHRWVKSQVYQAHHDVLTGLKNRALFDNMLSSYISQSKGQTALMMIDIDNFKKVNDQLGHMQGDKLLKRAAQVIDQTIEPVHSSFRLGGDEFAVILPNISKEEVKKVAEKILQALYDEFHNKDDICRCNVTASIGIALAPEHGKDAKTLFNYADAAMYKSKENGKNRYTI